MNRINQIIENLASTAWKAAPLVTVLACFVLGSKNLVGGPQCYGGSTIKNSAGQIVGCAYSTWGTADKEESHCGAGTVVFGSSSNNCHICVVPPYDSQVSKNDFSGLTLTPIPYPGEQTPPPTTFACLKCAQPPAGLTAWWTLDETDASVRNITPNFLADGLRFGGANAVFGAVGNATHFNGVNQYIQIPDDPQLNVGPGATDGSGDFSIDAWVKIDPNTNSSGVRVILEKRTANPYKGYSFYLYNRYLGLQLADATGYSNYGAPSLTVKDDGLWHFVAVSVRRQTGAFDVQFILDPDKTPTVDVYSPARTGDLGNSSPVRIGMLTIGTGSVFNGSIDEVEFFKRAVTLSEWEAIQSAGCYGKCAARAVPVPFQQPTVPNTCMWDPVRRIWNNCTN